MDRLALAEVENLQITVLRLRTLWRNVATTSKAGPLFCLNLAVTSIPMRTTGRYGVAARIVLCFFGLPVNGLNFAVQHVGGNEGCRGEREGRLARRCSWRYFPWQPV